MDNKGSSIHISCTINCGYKINTMFNKCLAPDELNMLSPSLRLE